MNNEAYSSYPQEAEVLLCDGCDMFVLAVDRGVVIQNTCGNRMECYEGSVVTVIHMYHTGYFKETKQSTIEKEAVLQK